MSTKSEHREYREYLKVDGSNRAWGLYCLSFVVIATTSGLVYGWPALRRSLLTAPDPLNESQLGVIFTVGSWSANAGRFFAGVIRDFLGTRYTCVSCLIIVTVGVVIVAMVEPNNQLALCFGFLFIGIGGGVQLSLQPVVELFPTVRSTVMAGTSGAYQMSALVFLLLGVTSDRRAAYLGYASYLLVCIALCSWVLPVGLHFSVTDDDDDKYTSPIVELELEVVPESVKSCSSNEQLCVDIGSSSSIGIGIGIGGSSSRSRSRSTSTSNKSSDDRSIKRISASTRTLSMRSEGKSNGDNKWEQFRSTEYLCLLLWFAVVIPPTQFYIISIGFQLDLRSESNGNGIYTTLFTVIFAASALGVPLMGNLADRFGVGMTQGLATLMVAVSFAILALPPSLGLEIQVVSMLLFGFGCGMIYGMFFSNIGRRFGFDNYGFLVGFGLITAAMTSLLQYPLLEWCISAPPGSAMEADLTCCGCMLATAPYVVWLGCRERRERREEERERERVEEERERDSREEEKDRDFDYCF